MRGIFVESLRGAIVRLLRTFIMIVIILLIVFIIGLFHQEKVHALVYVRDIWNTPSPSSMSGYLANGNSVTQKFVLGGNTIYTKDADYDVLIINFDKIMVRGWNDEQNSSLNCTLVPQGSNSVITCNSYNSNITDGQYFLSGVLEFDDHVSFSPCYFSTEYGNAMVCPMYRRSNRAVYSFNLTLKNSGYSGINYEIGINGLKNGYNYDSTEIVKGLQGVTIEQQNTTQAIEDLTTQQEQAQQYIENNNVTSSQTQFQGGVSDLSQQINAQISGVNDLTQIVLLPVTLFMDLSTGTCTPLHLVVPFTNNELDLPCMKPIYEEHFGGLLTIFSTIVCAVTTYWVSVNSAKLIKEILDCDNDRIEVIDL